MKAVYLGDFADEKDMLNSFSQTADALEGAKVLLAWYESGGYDGSAYVLFERDGKLFETSGSHCSCNGLEDSWSPEETSIEALEKRDHGYLWNGAADEALQKILATLKRRERRKLQ